MEKVVIVGGGISGIIAAINAKNNNEFDRESCIEQSKKYNKNDKFRQYIDLFN